MCATEADKADGAQCGDSSLRFTDGNPILTQLPGLNLLPSMIDLEVKDASQVGALVRQHGCAIWRNLVRRTITGPIIQAVNFRNLDDRAYAVAKGGVMTSSILPNKLRRARCTPEIRAGIRSILGEEGAIVDDGAVRSGIYLSEPSAKVFRSSHPWHQDAKGEFPKYAGCVWVALTQGCGFFAPGVSFVLRNPGRELPLAEMEEFISNGPVFAPILNIGDAVFFDSYSIHATFRSDQMTETRAAYKLTGLGFTLPDDELATKLDCPPETIFYRI